MGDLAKLYLFFISQGPSVPTSVEWSVRRMVISGVDLNVEIYMAENPRNFGVYPTCQLDIHPVG
jgi:hypothetical protein